jgi:hypothetical protein
MAGNYLDSPMTPAEKLELHLCREFVSNYIQQTLKRTRRAVINPPALFIAARMSGLKITTRTLEKVLHEMQKPRL